MKEIKLQEEGMFWTATCLDNPTRHLVASGKTPWAALNALAALRAANVPPAEQWAISHDCESFWGTFESKEAAIAEGRATYPTGVFYVGKTEPPTPPEDYFDAGDWLEHVCEQEGYSGDHAEGWCRATTTEVEVLTLEVRKLMAKWLDKFNLRPSFFIVPDPERIDPDETI